MNFDFDDFLDENSEEKEATLEYISEMASEATALSDEMENLQQQIDQLNVRFRHITEREMPRCFAELGMKSYEMTDGTKYQLKDTISASLERAPDRAVAVKWCEAQGWDELFTVDLSMTFGKGDRQEALDLQNKLVDDGFDVGIKEGIHSATFSKHLRELHKENLEKQKNGEFVEPIPFAELGAYHGTKAEIKRPKKK